MNATHGSDSRASASREIRFHFPKLTQVCPVKSGRRHMHSMLPVTQPDTHVAMVMVVEAVKMDALKSHDTQFGGTLSRSNASVGCPFSSAAQSTAQLLRGLCSPEQLMNSAPACSKFQFLIAGPSAGRNSCKRNS